MTNDQIAEYADDAYKIMEREKVELRARTNRIYAFCLRIISHNAFTFFVSLCIVVNTGTLALDSHPIDPQ